MGFRLRHKPVPPNGRHRQQCHRATSETLSLGRGRLPSEAHGHTIKSRQVRHPSALSKIDGGEGVIVAPLQQIDKISGLAIGRLVVWTSVVPEIEPYGPFALSHLDDQELPRRSPSLQLLEDLFIFRPLCGAGAQPCAG